MSKKTVTTEKTDKTFSLRRREEITRDENRKFFLQVIHDFDGRMGNKLYKLRARLNESWDEESRASPPQTQEYLEEEIKRLGDINENVEKQQRSREEKVKKEKKPPHERMLKCVSKGFRKWKKSVEEITGKSTENSTGDTNDYKRDTQTHSAYYRRTSSPSSLQWSLAKPGIFSIQESPQIDKCEGVGVAKGRMLSSPKGQRFKFKCRTKSEIKSDPKFSMYLLKWPPTESTLKPTLKKSGPVQEPTEILEQSVDVSIAGMSSTLKVPRINFKTRTVSEIRRDPQFSNFLLKWPPESSALKPLPKKCGTNKHSETWEKDIKKGHKHDGLLDLPKFRIPNTKPCEMLTQATHKEADNRDVGRLRIPCRPQTQQKLLGGSEIPDSCEHFMPIYTVKSAMNTSEASWESENKECPEDLSSVQSQKSGIQHRAAEVSKHLEKATTAKIYWMNHIKELENEAKSLEKELKEIDNKIEPRKPTTVSQGKGIHTKKFKRKLKKENVSVDIDSKMTPIEPPTRNNKSPSSSGTPQSDGKINVPPNSPRNSVFISVSGGTIKPAHTLNGGSLISM